MIGNIQSELKEHLDKDETLLWTGQPKSGIIFGTIDIFLIPFSLFWCSFIVIFLSVGFGGNWLFALFTIPFILVGIILLFGRFIIDAKNRANTFYGLTKNRVLIKSGIFSKKIKSVNIKTISEIELTEKSDGSGTVSIGPKIPFNVWGNGMSWMPGMDSLPQLMMIPNARKVYNQIVEIQNRN